MKIAIPIAAGKVALHFGHCKEFAVIETQDDSIISETVMTPPHHEPGVLPKWMKEVVKADKVIAGGMGSMAANLFRDYGIEVITGATAADPKTVVEQYLANKLETGDNSCDH